MLDMVMIGKLPQSNKQTRKVLGIRRVDTHTTVVEG